MPKIDKTREATILSAFFGLDNALPARARLLHPKAPGNDGMPLVFSLEVDPATLDASDFAITTQDGSVYQPEGVTLLPAEEAFELRTALLIGDYGNHPDNPPVYVEVVGELKSRTGASFVGQTAEVIPLEAGPTLSYAEYFSFDDGYPYIAEGAGCDCPKEGTAVVVKVVWAGGVRALNGEELGLNEKDDFLVTIVSGTDTIVVAPYMLADLGDNDNNIDLCLKQAGIPLSVTANAGIAIDPNDDVNPETSVAIRSRW